MSGALVGPVRALLPGMSMNWQHEDASLDAVEVSFAAAERRRRMKPVVAAIVLVATLAIGLLVAAFYSAALPYPYAM